MEFQNGCKDLYMVKKICKAFDDSFPPFQIIAEPTLRGSLGLLHGKCTEINAESLREYEYQGVDSGVPYLYTLWTLT